jgi:tetratricopeptide (TPR) repeat protein
MYELLLAARRMGLMVMVNVADPLPPSGLGEREALSQLPPPFVEAFNENERLPLVRFFTGSFSETELPPALTLNPQVTWLEVETPLQLPLLLLSPSTEKAVAAYADVPRPSQRPRKIRIPDNFLTRPSRQCHQVNTIIALTAILTENGDPLMFPSQFTAQNPRYGLTATSRAATKGSGFQGRFSKLAVLCVILTCPSWSQVKSRGLEHPEEARKKDTGEPGRTYAVLIGVSHYKNDPPITSLQFADKDAETFAAFLRTPLGGALDPDDIRLLTNDHATRAAMDAALKEAVERKGGANNVLILFVGAHGVYLTEEEDPVSHKKIERDPYVLLADTNIQDPKTTGFPMEDLRRTVAELTTHFGRVLVFLDVCHAANVAGIAGGSEMQDAVKKAWSGQTGEFGLMMASHAGESAIESAAFGGGHGAFSYFLFAGMNGPAAFAGDNEITFADLAQYVRNNVRRVTHKAQDPFDEARDTAMVVIPDIKKEGLALPPAQPLSDQDLRDIRRRRGIAAGPRPQDIALPDDTDVALALLEKLRRDPTQTPETIRALERRLRVTLEDLGQAVMSRYLEGEEVPQTKTDFDRCARWFQQAAKLSPDPAFDNSRAQFCEGRALIFDKQYATAGKLLQQSIAIDPRRAYSFNALGIAYLEQISQNRQGFAEAESAFRSAMRFAPYWAYPIHNLALTLAERGDYDGAIRAYQYAMSIAPRYSYLPYNLGLLYQRLGDFENARLWYQKAQQVLEKFSKPRDNRWPERARTWNALGTLAREEKRDNKAEELFRKALADDPDDPNSRHNLALVLAHRGNFAEADPLWRANTSFVASQVALADSLAQRGQTAQATQEYLAVIAAKPEYVAAREALAKLYLHQNDASSAIVQLDAAMARSGQVPALLELRADARAQSGEMDAARADWTKARELSLDGADKARLSRKLKSGERAQVKQQ